MFVFVVTENHHSIFAVFIAMGVVFLLAGITMLIGGIVSILHPVVTVSFQSGEANPGWLVEHVVEL